MLALANIFEQPVTFGLPALIKMETIKVMFFFFYSFSWCETKIKYLYSLKECKKTHMDFGLAFFAHAFHFLPVVLQRRIISWLGRSFRKVARNFCSQS